MTHEEELAVRRGGFAGDEVASVVEGYGGLVDNVVGEIIKNNGLSKWMLVF